MTASHNRIATLDNVRGVAVMGILAMNIIAFAMPIGAYMNPMAYGSQTSIDLSGYAFNFVLIDGKMRGLFSFLFGASMLLVIEKAEAKGENAASVHFRRMLVLLMFGGIPWGALSDPEALGADAQPGVLLWIGGLLAMAWVLGTLIPGIAVVVRRLHDRDMSGWWYLGLIVASMIPLINIIASIGFLVLMVLPGTAGPNRFGPDPLDPSQAEVFA